MYRLTNRYFEVVDISTLETKIYKGMRECNQATGITMYKLHMIADGEENKNWYITTTKGNAYKVTCVPDIHEPLIIAYPVLTDMFSPIKFKSVTKIVQQFGVGKNTIYRRWAEAFPVYKDNPTELIVDYWQNNTPVTCKNGNAFGEKFILRFYKKYDKGNLDAFENNKGFGRNGL